jgi:RNA-directed DNA polymerase
LTHSTEDLARLLRQLIRCYERCIKNKPKSRQSNFHIHFERHLISLAKDILARKYKPWKVRFFVVTEPRPREIVAAHLRDRAVHHLIYERLEPLWTPLFSAHSYACRKGKGPLMATRDLQRFLKLHRGESLFYLKMDISNFFQSIDRKILARQLDRVTVDDETQYLVDETLAFDQVSHCDKIGNNWDHLPPHKSLFNVPRGIGLPIGNLTSQFFANVYLNYMDHWIESNKGEYSVLFWQRYVDDVLVIAKFSKDLVSLSKKYDHLIQTDLKLTLNPTKTQIQPVCRGIDQVGFIHTPTHLRIRDRVKRNLKKVVNEITAGPREMDVKFTAQINSYLGLMAHADTMRLRSQIVKPLTTYLPIYTRFGLDAVYQNRLCPSGNKESVL